MGGGLLRVTLGSGGGGVGNLCTNSSSSSSVESAYASPCPEPVLGEGDSRARLFSTDSYGVVSTEGILSLNFSKNGALTEPGDGVRTIEGEMPALVVEVEERDAER